MQVLFLYALIQQYSQLKILKKVMKLLTKNEQSSPKYLASGAKRCLTLISIIIIFFLLFSFINMIQIPKISAFIVTDSKLPRSNA